MSSVAKDSEGYDNKIIVDGILSGALDVCRNRLLFSVSLFVIFYLVICLRLFELTTLTNHETRHTYQAGNTSLDINRGNIVDRQGVVLSTNLETSSLFINPKKIIDPEGVATSLAAYFKDLNYKDLLKNCSNKLKSFIWVKRNLAPSVRKAVHEMGMPGVYFKDEQKRFYPHSNVASHLLGFVGVDGRGLTGLEKHFDSKLIENSHTNAQLQLSLDMRVQDTLHGELLRNMDRFKAKGASGIVMDVNNGEILGMVSLPDFDPNNPKDADAQNTFNRASYGLYEMGSTFKPFTVAAALDEEIIEVQDKFDATKPLWFAGHTIRDYHAKNEWLYVPEILMYSSNIGMARIAKELGAEKQRNFLGKLGMLEEIDLEISEKSKPMLPERWGTIHSMTVSFGHGLAVTPLHVATAMSAIVNGGFLYKPTIIKHQEEAHGDRIMKVETSDMMRRLLRNVVEKGSGSFADIDGYLVGGKTGTAEKLVDGKYDSKAKISSFIGVFPMHKPKYVVLVMLDEPKGDEGTFGIATGGFTAAPVVGRVIEKIAPIMGVEPVDKESPEILDAMKIEGYKWRKDLASR